MGSCYIAQGARLSAVWQHRAVGWGGVGGRLKREEIYVYLQLIHIIIQQKPTQNCKAITLQKNKIKLGCVKRTKLCFPPLSLSSLLSHSKNVGIWGRLLFYPGCITSISDIRILDYCQADLPKNTAEISELLGRSPGQGNGNSL